MKTIKVRYEDLPKLKLGEVSPVRIYCKKLLNGGAEPDTRIEFFRDHIPDEFSFAITNLGEYLKYDLSEAL